MALKSGVFACLTLALCVSCNVMAQNIPQSEDRGIIVPRSEHLGKETEKSRSEHLETEKSGRIIPRSEHLGKETEKSGTPRSAEHLGKETQKTGPVSGP